jgi:SPP1 gp7 family putative phage head morphogenesis protein
MNKAIELQIEKIYKEVFKKVYTSNVYKSTILNKEELKNNMFRLQESKKYQQFAKKFAIELAKKGLATKRGVWKKYFITAQKRGLISVTKSYSDFQKIIFKNAVKTNFKMIKTIPKHVTTVIQQKQIDILFSQFAEGALGRKTFEKMLYTSGYKHAKLIARTETAKLQTALVEDRAKNLNSVVYKWLSSNDNRTRQSHKDMNGVIVFWRDKLEEKPLLDDMYGNAGEFPNCRCSPELVLDESDLTSTNYKVYDYKTHKVVNLTKQQLIDKLYPKKKGG